MGSQKLVHTEFNFSPIFNGIVLFIFRPLNVTRPVFPKDLAVLNAALLTFFKEKVSVPQKDTRRNSKAVNDLLKEILYLIRKQDETFGLRILNTGKPLFNRMLL